MDKYRIAIVSATGTGQKRTIPALAGSTVCSVVAIHGRDEQRLTQIAGRYNIGQVFTDLETMIATSEFDFAIVCSPPFLHSDHIKLLLGAGIPVLVEKPLASTLADAVDIERYATNAGVPVRVAHHLRHQSAFREISSVLDNGDLGDVCRANFEWSFRLNRNAANAAWKLDPRRNGWTPLSDAGIHCLDIAVALFGPGSLLWADGKWSADRSIYDDVEIITKHGEILVHITSSWLYGPYTNQLLISATDGAVIADQFFTERSSESIVVISKGVSRIISGREGNPYREEVEDFARLLADPNYLSVGTSLGEAIASMRIITDVERMLVFRIDID